ncbi:MAG: hypothetical protein K0S18_2110 [Anaerocolumna sp.]|jgi:murein DD-endopeptidase MepM/ murein hydrolase activator NlpD|nr:hypothetical protein [Anaerocolumna sp.]
MFIWRLETEMIVNKKFQNLLGKYYRNQSIRTRNKFYIVRDNKSKSNPITYYLILLFIATVISGYMMNYIGLHMAVKQVTTQGIDYDAFREMILEKKQLETMIHNLNNRSGNNNMLRTSLDDFTLSMMLSNYGRNGNKIVSKNNLSYLYKKLKTNSSFLELKEYYTSIFSDISCFPTGVIQGKNCDYSMTNTWNSYRSYGGNRRHEGTDIFPEENIRGVYPVVSMTEGIVEKMGWLEQGGYRIGIRGKEGAYYYYAHLDSYAKDVQIGDFVKAGQFLGFMGDSGYGKEGTIGMFDVHLHFGIYVETPFGELSVNPYWILLYLKSS